MPPLVSIVGRSKSGKTTLLEKLLRELSSRGYRVATIKHASHGMSFDRPDKDSWRHLQAGSVMTIATSKDKMVLVRPLAREATLDEIVRTLGEDCDLILTEGFKHDGAPKIEVQRREVGPPLSGIKRLIAIVTDEPLKTGIRRFSSDDIKGLADFIETGFIRPRRERLSVYVNNILLSLGTFPKEFVASTLLAMVSSLKGVGEIESLDVFLRRDKRTKPPK
jgi:molybdopterin-guanine dinucleotide biosynthesis protein B